MTWNDDRDRRIAALEDRLTRLSEASLSINDSLELDAVLQKALDSARSLTGARYGVMTTLDAAGRIDDFLASGFTPEEAQRLWAMPGGREVFDYINSFPEPLRLSDFPSHARAMGLPEFRPPVPMSSFLAVPIRHRGVRVGNIHMGNGEPGQTFSREDEETLVMFASQAALVIANARQYRDERQARSALETLVETSPVGVVVFDGLTGAPLSFNREASRIVDDLREPTQRPEELLDVMTVRRADGREVSLREWPFAEALSAGETVRAEEIVLSVPDGRSVAVLLNATPIRSPDGGIESFVITLQDMTPLEEPARLRAEFLGMVSHELRSPLMSIRGSATAVLDAASDLAPAELRQFQRIIVDQSDNMRELIDDLLDVARIETGALPVSPEPTEVALLVDRARNIFLSGGGRSSLDIDLAPRLPAVMADRRRIVQVIGNLLSNAARHSPAATTIKLGAFREGGHVVMFVADEGRGIPSEQLPRLFRKFSETGAREQAGDTGLGLVISRGIVAAHGGRIWAESEGPSLGARFSFTLPVAEEATLAARAFAASGRQEMAERASGGDPILVVDDDPQTLRYVRQALSGAGYDPTVAADPEEALRLIAENRPVLALLDMMLPGSDGIELMQDIFAVADVPVVFLSAYGQEEIIARAFDMGASDYIVKPFAPAELVARVRAALRRRGGPFPFETPEPYVLGDLTIDYAMRLVSVAGRPAPVTAKEYDLLRALSLSGGRTLTYDQLLRRVWGGGKSGNVAALRTHVRRLRRKLDDDAGNPKYIIAERRVGYRMASNEAPAGPE